jgi:UDP-glucose:(heptosyl)LPS alpha-1,3-glucosyltransferase
MGEPLNIAILVKSFSRTGGMERYVVETCQRLAERGHRLDILAREAETDLPAGARFVPVPKGPGFSGVARAVSFARQSARLLAGRSYDIVHSHERGYCQDILTLHCFSHLQGLAQYSWLRRLDQKYLSLRNLLYLWLERRQMATPWLVAVSDAIAEDVRRHYGRTENIAVIPPGVDTELFHPARVGALRDTVRGEEGIGARELAVLFVGSEFRRKGLDLLIPAIGPGMRLLVVGRGENHDHYRRLVERCGLAGRVAFAGLSGDVQRWYAAADVLVLPSRSEAFGMSVLEAMACGLPVIVSGNSGVASLIRHGENGYLAKEPAELAGLLQRLAAPEERQRLGGAARVTAEEHSWQRVTDAHEELYRRVVADKNREKVR